jgi:hypothetical protein
MLIPMLNEHHDSSSESIPPPVDFGHPSATEYVQTLIGAGVTVAGPAFGVSGWDNHFGCLTSPVANRDPKPTTESECFALHGTSWQIQS